jgi:hypothetical protein
LDAGAALQNVIKLLFEQPHEPFILPPSISCTATKAAMMGDASNCHKTIIDYSAHHYQTFSHYKISGPLMSFTGAAFANFQVAKLTATCRGM